MCVQFEQFYFKVLFLLEIVHTQGYMIHGQLEGILQVQLNIRFTCHLQNKVHYL